MLNHFKKTTGYTLLYLLLLLLTIVSTGLAALMTKALGLGSVDKIAGVIVFAAFWILAFISMQRFILIEKRRPTLWEANTVGVKSVVYTLATIISLVVFLTLIILLIKVLTGGFEAGGPPPAPPSEDGAPKAPATREEIKPMLLTLCTITLLYAAPFLNFAVISRLFAPKAKAV